jgi:hypothetical protein
MADYEATVYSSNGNIEESRPWLNRFHFTSTWGLLSDPMRGFATQICHCVRVLSLTSTTIHRVIIGNSTPWTAVLAANTNWVYPFSYSETWGKRMPVGQIIPEAAIQLNKTRTLGRSGRAWIFGSICQGDVIQGYRGRLVLVPTAAIQAEVAAYWGQTDEILPDFFMRTAPESGFSPCAIRLGHVVRAKARFRFRPNADDEMLQIEAALQTAVDQADVVLTSLDYLLGTQTDYIAHQIKQQIANIIGQTVAAANSIKNRFDCKAHGNEEQPTIPFSRWGVVHDVALSLAKQIKTLWESDKEQEDWGKIQPYDFAGVEQYFTHEDGEKLREFLLRYAGVAARLYDYDYSSAYTSSCEPQN